MLPERRGGDPEADLYFKKVTSFSPSILMPLRARFMQLQDSLQSVKAFGGGSHGNRYWGEGS